MYSETVADDSECGSGLSAARDCRQDCVIPQWWNYVPNVVHIGDSLGTFEKHLKTHLLKQHLTCLRHTNHSLGVIIIIATIDVYFKLY